MLISLLGTAATNIGITTGAWRTLSAPGGPRRTALLFILAVMAVVNWGNWGPKFHPEPHRHEIFHYVMGAKYFTENGYFGLYTATAAALAETRGVRGLMMRNLLNKGAAAVVISDAEMAQAKARFSPERWGEFCRDLEEIQRGADGNILVRALKDSGFNPAPGWLLLGNPVAQIIPVRSENLWLFGMLDIFLLAVGFGFVWWGFGLDAMLCTIILFASSGISLYSWTGGSFFRYTWLAGILAGVASLQRRRWWWAPFFFGWAAAERVFPLAFVFGACLPLGRAVIRQQLARTLMVSLLLWAFAATAFGGPAVHDWTVNMISHTESQYPLNHVGWKRIVTWHRNLARDCDFSGPDGEAKWESYNRSSDQRWRKVRPVAVAAALLLTVLVVLDARRRHMADACVRVGTAAVFFWQLPAQYYYVWLCVGGPAMALGSGVLPSINILLATAEMQQTAIVNVSFIWSMIIFLYLLLPILGSAFQREKAPGNA